MSFLISAPASGSGKTTITLGLLRALQSTGVAVRAAKSGPDYIDPRFHEAACGAPCLNLDAWAMTPDRIKSLASGHVPLIVEGAMGLFDGAPPDSKGSSADLARILGLPVILVIDAGKMAGSVGAIAHGFRTYDPSITVAGVILNNVGSPRHETMLRRALTDIPVFGALPRQSGLSQPSRHLGLVQAQERDDLEAFLDHAAGLVAKHCDLAALRALLAPLPSHKRQPMAPPAQRIAIAHDAAFSFSYPHMLEDWRRNGAEIAMFSPLANEAAPDADLVFLPGGYPELHAGRLASNEAFLDSLRHSKAHIYGECGGYMVLGDTLTDAAGVTHRMAGLLSLETSFAERKLHLGYRDLHAATEPFSGSWKGHEFHYATTRKAEGQALFTATDAEGHSLAPMGLVNGKVMGSFAHLIDRA
ncbi:cobyrinate a,c-diamide synthase [Yoonia litorea]|uniref:Hydrogenobyrinate a,c-diamide synthase n=1 Tax=Yoonia litorea TaxID=1123755 RepID=A0A1I6M9K8_9RHOB|nr:cobyrinate a,c-diamide synthase [Yoonia litorea]SFS12395.1 cobyrinic acid a,c-diamide synthase [Yoonia litorea]